jgi:competence protein ComEA
MLKKFRLLNLLRENRLVLILFFYFFISIFKFSLVYAVFEQREILPRPASLGGAYVAEYGESSCIYYNPAGLINLPKYDFLFSYTNQYNIDFLTDMTATFATEIKSVGKIGILWNSFGYDLYKENNIYFAYSKNLSSNFSTGFNIKSNSVMIKNYGSKSLVGLDLGFTGILTPSVVTAVVIRNLNSPEVVLTEKLAAETNIGFRLEYIANSPSYIDIIKPQLEDIYFRFGQEIFFNKNLSFRLGVETVTKDKPAKYSFGFMVKYKNFMFDYANVIHPFLGNQNLFSLGLRFGEKSSLGEIVFEEKVRPGTRRRTTKKVYSGKKLDLNKATVEELMQLPGVGPSLAQKIVEVRQMLGGYKSVDDLEEVPRMGKITLSRIKQYVYVEGSTTTVQETIEKPKVQQAKQKKVAQEKVSTVNEEEDIVYEEEIDQPRVVEQPKVVEPSKVIEQPKVVEPPQPPQVEQKDIKKSVTEEKQIKKETTTTEEISKPVVEKYNVNKLSENELKQLGFSDTDAKNIVRYRTKFGNFKSVDELKKVPNINKKILEKIKENLVVED